MKSSKLFDLALALSVVFTAVLIGYIIYSDIKSPYCGRVVEKYITSAVYKVPGQHRVVFYCDSLHKNINIEVSPNAYSNCDKGETVCFELAKRDVE